MKWFDGKSDKLIEYNGGCDFEVLIVFIIEKIGIKFKKKFVFFSSVIYLIDVIFKNIIGGDKYVFVVFIVFWCGCRCLFILKF